jgi:hypothetical protein
MIATLSAQRASVARVFGGLASGGAFTLEGEVEADEVAYHALELEADLDGRAFGT